MEWLEDVEEGRYYVEECMKNQVDTEEIGQILDSEKEQDVLECEEGGNEADPLYDHLNLGKPQRTGVYAIKQVVQDN